MAGEAANPQGNGETVNEAADRLEKMEGLFDDGDEDNDGDNDEGLGDPEEGDSDQLGDDEGDDDVTADEDDDQQDPDEAQGKGRLITVRVNGKDEKVSESEAAAGYMRTKDYTQKTMAVAEQRRAAEAVVNEYTGQIQAYGKLLEDALKTGPSETELAALKETDPTQYLMVMKELDEVKAERDRVKREQHRLHSERQQKETEAVRDFVEKERGVLLEKLPTWKDAKVAKREIAAISKGLEESGFTAEEIAQLYDHRALLLARDAMLYRNLKAGKGREKVKPVPAGKTLRPGTPQQSKGRVQSGLKDARQRLNRTGSTRDAAAVFERMPGLLDS